MSEQRKCRVCGCSIEHLHFNVRYCGSAECRDEQKRRYFTARNASTASVHYAKRQADGVYCPTIYSMPSGNAGSGRARGHAGTNFDPAAQAEERKNALAWLLKGRKPEGMNPAKIKINVKLKSWRERHAEALEIVRRKRGVVA